MLCGARRCPLGRWEPLAPRLHTGEVTDHVDFTVVLRGYDIAAVDGFLLHVQDVLDSDDSIAQASARQELREVTFRVRLRGYDRAQVDDYLHRLAAGPA
jgi:DivIVA domain-containing protein